MKIAYLYCLIFILSIDFINGQNLNDSILNNQVEATKNVSEQVRKFRKEFEKLIFQKKENGKPEIDNIAEIKKDISNINIAYLELAKKVSLSKRNEKKEESIWQKSMPQMIGAFIGVGSALFVFSLNMWRERRKDRKKRKKEHTEKIHYLSSLIKSTITLSKKQLNGVKKFCQKIDEKPMILPLISIYPRQDIDRLSKTFDNEQYYHAFLDEFGDKTDKVELYRGLANDIDYLLKQFEQIFDMQQKAQMFDIERRLEYKKQLEISRNEILRVSQGYETTNKQFSDFIFDIFKNYHDQLNDENRTDLTNVEEILVAPLKKGFIYEYIGIKESDYFVIKLNSLSSIYNDIPLQNKAHSNSYKTLFENIEKAISNLEINGKDVLSKLQTTSKNK